MTTRHISGCLGALFISLTLLTAACGQKGDLYHPERGQQYQQSSTGQ